MTTPDYMATKPVTHEVIPVASRAQISEETWANTYSGADGKWYIEINDGTSEVMLTGPEAIVIAEFIATHVRKRW